MKAAYAISDTDVLFVLGSLGIGGTEKHVMQVATVLAARGWRIAIHCLAEHGPMLEPLRQSGARIITPDFSSSRLRRWIARSPLRSIVMGWQFVRLLSSSKPSVVQFMLPSSYLLCGPLAVAMRHPILVMNRRSLNLYQRNVPFSAIIERGLHRFMSAVVGNSLQVTEDLKREGVRLSRLGLIYNGIAIDYPIPLISRREMRLQLAISQDALTLVVVANLIPYKGHQDLIDALGAINAQLPRDWKMLVVGRDDGIGSSLQAKAAERGIAEHLMFLGERTDVEDLYNASDLGILASHQEGFANSVLEGMRAGLPMVVTGVGGNPEAVVDGATGFVVPAHDPSALAKAILTLAQDRTLRESFGAAGRARIFERFSFNDCINRYEALYRGLQAGQVPQDIPEVRIV